MRPHRVVAIVAGVAVLAALAALAASGVVPGLPHIGRPLAVTADPSPGAPAASPGALTLVALGDSVPAAETCGCAGYVERVGARLHELTQRTWAVHNDAVGGWTTADVEGDLGSTATRAHLAGADLVLVEVGANDFDLGRVGEQGCLPAASSGCWSETLRGLRDGLIRIIGAIRRVDRRPDVRIALLGYWNVTVDGSVGRALGEAFLLGSDDLTRVVNDTVRGVATATGVVYVDAYSPLKGVSGARDPTSDLLDDGDHPNASGHTLLTTAVVDALVRSGAVTAWRSSP